MTNEKFEVEKFNSTNNFSMWQCEVLDVLCQQELELALEEKPNKIDDKEWIKINRQACGTIRLCLAKDQKYFVWLNIWNNFSLGHNNFTWFGVKLMYMDKD